MDDVSKSVTFLTTFHERSYKNCISGYFKQVICNKIDIALLDLDIHSGLGGFPSMRQLKKTDNNIKGILITGHSQESQAENYKDYGFSIMLEKPFSITRLDQAIRKLL